MTQPLVTKRIDRRALVVSPVTSPARSAYMKMMLRTLVVPLALFASTALADTTPKTDSARIEIAVTRSGFEPGNISVPAKKPVKLVFTRKTDQTCTKSVVVTLDDGKKLERELPLDTPVELAVTFPKAGKLTYACSMDMIKGFVVVQ
jgi:plastocyanin domain-containing protein